MTPQTPAPGMTSPLPAAGSNRPHGYARYKLDGCRCYTCGFAASQYNAARTRAIAYGTWQPYVDATPMREHLERLREGGLGLRRIAELAGVDRKRLQAVLTGRSDRGAAPQERIRPAIAAAVLRVEVSLETISPGVYVDITGTLRRLQALVAIGWPQARLGARLGVSPTNFSTMLRASQVTARRALDARALYAELWNQDPRQHGVTEQSYRRARNAAAAASWPPPAAWDDDEIDIPTAAPAQATDEALNLFGQAAARRSEIEHLTSFGLGPEEIAPRLGIRPGTVRDVIRGLEAERCSA